MNTNSPDKQGFFGEYGGQQLPPELKQVMDDISAAYDEIKDSDDFKNELNDLQRHYVGRPSPIYFCRRLTEQLGGAEIYLKREDLNHTGAHKINHCLGEALLAKKMGKTKILAETGAGQHGVALAAASALVGIKCEIHMGEIDIEKQAPNVLRMKLMGANVIPVARGTKSLKDAVDNAFEEYLSDPQNFFYAIGSVVGPHPFPQMVRDFQKIVGIEAREQFQEMTNSLPDTLVACVGGGSNAMGLFTAFLNDKEVNMVGVEPSGLGLDTPDHAATISKGSPGIIHGMRCYLLQDDAGEPLPVYSIASGLDYPGIGPQHSYLKDIGRVQYESATDKECLNAFVMLSRTEGIIPALESAHAVAHAIRIAPQMAGKKILINLSGRGDKDIDFVADKLNL
ncbi:MAG: tryptophan synthase subunit beta [Desulfobacteraceae bacterium 4572_35.1]|nr:MAG: tryptophan synthase subunit beta [Desulfobacteraceae bacterium 4572_35.1]